MDLEEYAFFKHHDSDQNNVFWNVDFGKDVVGAAFLITKILCHIFDQNLDSPIFYHTTVDNLLGGSNEDADKWERDEATDEYKDLLRKTREKNSQFISNVDANSSSSCFIATATMGSYDHPEVKELRRFRDNWLLKRSWGRTFTKYYYRYGPYLAKFIEKNIIFKKLTYFLIIKPLLFVARNIFKFIS